MIGDFEYKGYKIIISGYSDFHSSQEQSRERLNQRITIIGLDTQVNLFLENISYSEAKAEVKTLIDKKYL
jgi:hypothetical protein